MRTLLRNGLFTAALLVGAAMPTVSAMADGGRGPARADRHYYPSIWQGLYAGFHIGHGEAGPADGVVGGGQIGYNWRSGQLVYGLEADVTFADIGIEHRYASASIDWMATGRGRLGYLLTPSILAYGTAGFGFASGSGSVSGIGSFSDTESDLVYGIGLEAKVSPTMSARIEYLGFSDLEIDVIRAGLNFKLGQ
jgi:outer membrane immunogenic protein